MLPIVTVYDGTRQANIASSVARGVCATKQRNANRNQTTTATTTEPGIAEQKRIATKIAWARK